MMENEEPNKQKNDANLIFALNQTQEGFPNPTFVLPIDELGFMVKKKLPKQKIVVAHYWIKKKKQISLIGALSALTISAILVQETGIFDTIFQTITSAIIFAISYVQGVFFA